MTKKEIAEQLAKRSGLQYSQTLPLTDMLIDIFKDAFANGENIYLRGFGTFAIRTRKERIGRDLYRDMLTCIVPEKRIVKFSQSPSLKVK